MLWLIECDVESMIVRARPLFFDELFLRSRFSSFGLRSKSNAVYYLQPIDIRSKIYFQKKKREEKM